MKKLFAILMALTLTMSMAACGAKDTSEPEKTETTKATKHKSPTRITKATEAPTVVPTEAPTVAPTEVPTVAPTEVPTEMPTAVSTKPVVTTKATTTTATKPVVTTQATAAPTKPVVTTKATVAPTTATKPATVATVHTHTYTEKVTKAATCGAEGVKTFTCICGDAYTQKLPVLKEHTWGAWTTVKESTVLEKGQSQRKCSVCSTTEKKDLALLNNRFYNDTLEGRWMTNSITVVPVEVYFENGGLVLNCYIVNGFSTTATNTSILEITVKDANGKIIAHDTFPEQNGTINALSYVTHSFHFGASAIENTAVDMSSLGVNARFYCRH